MPLLISTCNCGSSDQLVRTCLQGAGFSDWASAPIIKGKEKTRVALAGLPPFPEVEMFDHFLETTGKWAVILGYNDEGCRWSDIAHNAPASTVKAEFIVKVYS